MLHKRSAALILAVSLPALAGCVQATRHSNTMVFGTNTSLAARIGQSVAQVPEVSVGYSRQEAVIMPLLANTGDRGGRNGVLSPCSALVTPTPTPTPTPPPTELPKTNEQPHPCKFVATNTSLGGISFQDSYSVLASFGANIKARSPGDSTKNSEIGVGIAQYFATGVAAQFLAANGGAAVVSVSQGATESAKNPNKAVPPIAKISTAETQGKQLAENYDDYSGILASKVLATDESQLPAKIAKFETEAGLTSNPLSGPCEKKGDCVKAIAESIVLPKAFFDEPDKMRKAIESW